MPVLAVLLSVSIHASVKDATNPRQETYFRHHVSIHASVKDATSPNVKNFSEPMFQSTRP